MSASQLQEDSFCSSFSFLGFEMGLKDATKYQNIEISGASGYSFSGFEDETSGFSGFETSGFSGFEDTNMHQSFKS